MRPTLTFFRNLSVSTKMILIATFLIGTAALIAQQQQSGGVVVPSNISVAGSLPAGSNTIGNVGINGSLPPGTNVIGNIGNTGFAINAALPNGTNVLGFVRSVAPNTCGTTEYDSGMTFIPATTTTVTATVTCPQSVILNNTDTVEHTVTITDGSTLCGGAACATFGPSFVIPAKSQIRVPMEGAKFVGGIKWSADQASKVVGVVRGNQ